MKIGNCETMTNEEPLTEEEHAACYDEPRNRKSSDEDLTKIAKELWSGKIYTNRHDGCDAAMVFMPLVLGGVEMVNSLAKNQTDLIYEYLDKASPRSVNGRPCFFSFQTLNVADTNFMFAEYKKIVAMVGEPV